jgi:predicted nucleic acid-binding protein
LKACYLDTSLLVPLLIREPGTPRVQAFLSASAAKALLISPWTITEFSSALALKERVGSISHQERRAALTMFDKFRSLRMELVSMEAADFEAAARLCDASVAALRAGDALHLAVCRRVRGSLATMDQGLAAAGQEAGLAVELIQP